MPLYEQFESITCVHASEFRSVKSSDTELDRSETNYTLPTLTSIDDSHLELLREDYAHLHPDNAADFSNKEWCIPSIAKQFAHINLFGKKLSSTIDKTAQVPYALAKISQTDESTIHHSRSIGTLRYSHLFAVCKWPEEHPEKDVMGKPVQVWCFNSFDGINCFIPLESIVSHVIIATESTNNENVLAVIPLVD